MNSVVHDAQVAETAGRLLGRVPSAIRQVMGGGNNRLYQVWDDQQAYALKYYPVDERDRLGTEYAALKFMTANGVDSVPAPLACARNERVALYQWIDGERPDRLSAQDLDVVTGLVDKLRALGHLADARSLPVASAACLSNGAAFEQLNQRIENLLQHVPKDSSVVDFIRNAIVPARDRLLSDYQCWLASEGMSLSQPLPADSLFLSPSDFGRHNMLRQTDGRLVFLDFEYFGWDDAVKFSCDFVLHPGSAFSVPTQLALLTRVQALFSATDPLFSRRLKGLFGVFGLIWCLIMLNVFIPVFWQRRETAGQAQLRDDAQNHQLSEAKLFYARIWEVLDVYQSF